MLFFKWGYQHIFCHVKRFFGHTVFLRSVSGWFSISHDGGWWSKNIRIYSFGEVHLCLLKKNLVSQVVFSFYIKNALKNAAKTFGSTFFESPYHLNRSQTPLDTTLSMFHFLRLPDHCISMFAGIIFISIGLCNPSYFL